MVNFVAGCERHFAVIDGTSDLVYQLGGSAFRRLVRATFGIAVLARRPIVEIIAAFEITAA